MSIKTVARSTPVVLLAFSLAACSGGGSSANPPSSSTTSSAATSSTTSTSPSSDGALQQITADVTAPSQYPKAKWAATGELVGTSGSIVVNRVDATHLSGVKTSDGSTAWTLDASQPPGMKLATGASISFTQSGNQVAVEWKGTTASDSLNTGKTVDAVAMFDIATGKQVGSLTSSSGDDYTSATPSWVATSNIAVLQSWDQNSDVVKVKFTDGTVSTVPPKTADQWMSWTGGGYSHLVVIPLTPTAAVVTWEADSDHHVYWQPVTLGTYAKSGVKSQCNYVEGGQDQRLVSPDGTKLAYASGVILDAGNPTKIKCLQSVSNANIVLSAVANDGAVFGKANGSPFYLPANASKPVALPAGTTLPNAVTADGALFNGSGGIAMFGQQ